MSYWQNSTSTDYLEMLDQLLELATSDHVATTAVNVGGTGYVVGDILTVAGGTSTHTAKIEVTAVSAGVITAVRVDEGGAYTVDPSLTANAVTGGTGTGATMDLTMHDSSVQTATINAAGTGYAINDILTVVGGTFSTAATITVTVVGGGGEVQGIRIAQSGLYSVDPTLTANAVTTNGGGTGATIDLTMGGQWRIERRSQEAVSATIAAGGTGYTVGDDITLLDDGSTIRGDVSDTPGVAAVFNVDTVSGGVVIAVSLVTAGNYEETPADPVATSGGTGTGCTLNVTFQVATTQDQVVILESVGDAGSDQIVVGIKTFNRTDVSTFNTVRNWALFGFTGFNPALVFEDQPAISPGVVAGTGVVNTTGGGAFVPLKESTAFNIEFWVSTRGNRLICWFKVEDAVVTHYANMYLGFHNSFGTDAEEPYPIYVAGCTGRDNSLYTDTTMGRLSSLIECHTILSRPGPAFFRLNNVWTSVRNGSISDSGSPSRSQQRDFTVWPYGEPTLAPATDDLITIDTADAVQWSDIIPVTGIPGSANVQLEPTDNTGDDVRLMVPATIIVSDNAGDPIYVPVGELDNIFWVAANGGITAEDTFDIGDDRYLILSGGNQTQNWSYVAIKAE